MTSSTELDDTSPARLPWDAPDLFPLKPADADYGYVARGRAAAVAGPEQLAEAVRRPDVSAGLVWTPQNPRLTPPEEVPFLFDAVRERGLREAKYAFNTARIHIVMWSLLYLLYRFAVHAEATMFLILLLAFGIVPAFQAISTQRRLERAADKELARAAIAARYGEWLGSRRIIATWILAALLVGVFVAQVAFGYERSIHAAALVKQSVSDHQETWRLLTCVMLHGGLLHLAFNFIALLTVGRLLEVHAHPAYLPIVFLFSAICGSLASYYFGPQDVPSVGASGGLMGLIGFLLVMGYRRKHVLPPGFLKAILLSIAFIVAIGLVAAQMIDNGAHLGGLGGGVLLGLVYITRRRDAHSISLAPSYPALAAGVFCMAAIVGIAALAIWKISTFAS